MPTAKSTKTSASERSAAKKSAIKKSAAKKPAAGKGTATKAAAGKKTAAEKSEVKKAAVKKAGVKAGVKKAAGRKYSPAAGAQVAEDLHEMHKGQLHIGKSSKLVTNPKQAIAIGLAQARRAGKKVPPNPNDDKR